MFGTTVDVLRKQVDRSPLKEFIVGPEGSLTYREYNQQVNRLANWLAEKGVQKGDNVGLLMLNCNELYVAILAVHKLGAIANLWNFRLRGREIGYLTEHVKARAIIFNYDFLNNLILNDKNIFLCVGAAGDLPPNIHTYAEIAESPDSEPVESSPGEMDLASVIYSSGTTGYPKGASYTHTTQLWSAIQYCLEMGLDRGRRGITAAPVIHGGATNFFMAYLFIGATFIDSGRYIPEQILQLVSDYKATELMAVPTQIMQLLDLAEQQELSPERVHNVFGCHLLNTFGMTENCSNTATMHSGFDPEEAWTTIGKSTYFWETRAVDMNEDEAKADVQITPPGRGQLIVKGPQNITQYYLSEKAPIYDDGWLFARDVVDLNDSGWMQIVDRVDETILSGGENIYPQEVEMFLKKHPLVADTAVIGLPDVKWGECVIALIIRKGAELQAEDIESYCLESDELARYKRPRKVVFVEELSKNVFGKLERYKLKKQYGYLADQAKPE
jgi:fatty-acyl-CoA synthase